jgi:predicted transcriptional regulator
MVVKKRLPDAEFEIMKVIWDSEPPVTTLQIMDKLEKSKDWKQQTVLTMLVRLIEKGFLTSKRVGRERNYVPIILEQDYMQVETNDFIKRYAGNSMGSLVKTLYDGQHLSDDDLLEIRKWLEERK